MAIQPEFPVKLYVCNYLILMVFIQPRFEFDPCNQQWLYLRGYSGHPLWPMGFSLVIEGEILIYAV